LQIVSEGVQRQSRLSRACPHISSIRRHLYCTSGRHLFQSYQR